MNKIYFDEALDLVNKEMKKALIQSPEVINQYLTHLARAQGKMIRATAVLIANEDGNGEISLGAIKAAGAIEIIHLASLVHDDVIDNADLRRGEETLQKKFGKRTAVICGDYLLSIALQMISDIPDRSTYFETSVPDYIKRLCLGELQQHINNNNVDISVFEYIKIISGKTAALFEASFYMGAVLGGYSKKEIRRYRNIGNYIGLIFQLQDDCIDFDQTVETARKPVQSDFEQGVITLPLIIAFGRLPEFKQKAKDRLITRNEINESVAISGGLEYTKETIHRYYLKATREIESLEISDEKRAKLNQILMKATGKYLNIEKE